MCENPKTIAHQQVGHALCQQPILKAAAAQHDSFQADAPGYMQTTHCQRVVKAGRQS